jgi:multidrug resistance efflux pump
MLQQQLQRTTEALEKLKAENEASKKKHIEWQDEQSDKLRDYREQRKKWQSDMAKAREHISEIEAILKVQDGQLEDARKRVFDLESELKVLRPTLVTIQGYETKVDQLTKQMTLWEQDTATIQEQKRYIEKLFSQWKATENILVSYRESEKRAKFDLKFVILLLSVCSSVSS